MDNMLDHSKKTALWHRAEGAPENLEFIVIADGGTSERLRAKSHPKFLITAPLKSS